MIILALETSSPIISVAMTDPDGTLADTRAEGNASTLLVPAIQAVLAKTGLSLKEVDAFAIGEGPGSYNGLRCGFATLTGLLLAGPKAVVQVNSLAGAVSGASPAGESAGFVLNARRGMLFFQKFLMEKGHPKPVEEGMVETVEKIPGWGGDSTAWFSYEVDGCRSAHPDAVAVARLARPILAGHDAQARLGEPRYLRPPV